MELWEYPRPKDDNGRGIHWFAEQYAHDDLVDRYINECRAMKIKWVIFLNGYDWALTVNDYLVDRLLQNDMMPILRVNTDVCHLPDWLSTLVEYYVGKGAGYFQIFNEPNLPDEWPGDTFPPDMMARLAEHWCDAAFRVIEAGGLPGFPGLATACHLYGSGEGEDLKYFADALHAINARLTDAQRDRLYDKMWISLHNYNMGKDPIDTAVTRQDSHCFKKFIIYDEVVREKTRRRLPILGTEGGTRWGRPGNRYRDTSNEDTVANHTVRSYQYMMDEAPDYFFCFCPWVIGSKVAGNNDPEFEETAWYRVDSTQRVVHEVKGMLNYARKYPPRARFWADRNIVVPGQSTTLYWNTWNIKSVTLDQQRVDLSGERRVQPADTKTYTLRAVPRQGAHIDKTITVTVTSVPEPADPSQPTIVNVADALPQYPRGNAPVGRYPTRSLSEITTLVIHHTNWEGVTPEKLAEVLVDNAHWPGIGYHFMIAEDGVIQQTNHLETVSFHTYNGASPYPATPNSDRESVGVAFVGQFTSGKVPAPAQLARGGQLCAWLLQKLNLTEHAIRPRCALMTDPAPNPSPGCEKVGDQWVWTWRDALLAEVRKHLQPTPPVVEPTDPFYHYLLFWKHPDDWAEEDWEGAQEYIRRFLPTCGFSVEEARRYQHVTIVGGALGVSESDAQALRDAGRTVERVAGASFEETAGLLQEMARNGQRFRTP